MNTSDHPEPSAETSPVAENPIEKSPPPASTPPPRGPRLRILVAAVVVVAIVLVIGIALGPRVHDWLEARSAANEAASHGATADAGDGTWYISQMHPWIIQPEPGQCPICGMDLTPVDPDRFAGEITIDPVVVQNIGVRVEPAELGAVEQRFRTVGNVVVDETRVADIVQRFGGWVETVQAGAQFDRVRAGDPLFTVYSPEVFVAERDYLSLRGGPDAQLATAARRKLELLGLPEEEIDRLEETGTATDTITIPSPADGVVWMKHVNAGSRIAPQMVAMQIIDLSVLWVEATIYERQLPFVRVGQEAILSFHDGSVSERRGTVAMIYPTVDPRTRETRARLVFDNADSALKPGTFATVEVVDQLPGEFVLVPSEAVIGTGTRKLLFVSLGRGRFEPRTVALGPQTFDSRVAILDGVAAGEQVVVSGQFLLDSESRMREALAKVMKGTLAGETAPAPPPRSSGVSSTSGGGAAAGGGLIDIDSATKSALASALDSYLALEHALYVGDVAAAIQGIGTVQTAFLTFVEKGTKADAHFVHRVPGAEELATTAEKLSGSDLASVRVAFGELSVPLQELVLAVGAPPHPDGAWVGMRCGMADGIRDDGAWLQIGNDPRNPYFGEASGMRSCAVDTWGLPEAAQGSKKEDTPETPASHEDQEGHTEMKDEAAPTSRPTSEKSPPSSDPPTAAVSAGVISSYLAVANALYLEDLETARQHAPQLGKEAAAWSSTRPGQEITRLARAIFEASTLQVARVALGDIGIVLRDRAAAGGWAAPDLRVHRCGMAPGAAEDGIWLQKAGGVPENPFFGFDHGMSECVSETWAVTASGLEAVDE